MALSDNVFASYAMDEASGNLVDRKGTYNLTQNGTVSSQTGKISGARGGYSDSNYFSGSFINTRNKNNDFSISFFFKTTESTGYKYFLNPTTNLAQPVVGFDIRSGTIWVAAYDLGYGVSFTSNTWHHIVLTWDGTNKVGKAYKDGSFVANLAGTITASSANWGGTIYIGRAFNAGYNGGSTYIDELNFWSTVLSASDVSTLYNSGNGLAYPFSETPAGWSKKIFGITPGKVNGISTTSISKVTGV